MLKLFLRLGLCDCININTSADLSRLSNEFFDSAATIDIYRIYPLWLRKYVFEMDERNSDEGFFLFLFHSSDFANKHFYEIAGIGGNYI